eukprot:COSAG01_NODE_2034_length_8582_cov_36.288459_6_plen_599_part_00
MPTPHEGVRVWASLDSIGPLRSVGLGGGSPARRGGGGGGPVARSPSAQNLARPASSPANHRQRAATPHARVQARRSAAMDRLRRRLLPEIDGRPARAACPHDAPGGGAAKLERPLPIRRDHQQAPLCTSAATTSLTRRRTATTKPGRRGLALAELPTKELPRATHVVTSASTARSNSELATAGDHLSPMAAGDKHGGLGAAGAYSCQQPIMRRRLAAARESSYENGALVSRGSSDQARYLDAKRRGQPDALTKGHSASAGAPHEEIARVPASALEPEPESEPEVSAGQHLATGGLRAELQKIWSDDHPAQAAASATPTRKTQRSRSPAVSPVDDEILSGSLYSSSLLAGGTLDQLKSRTLILVDWDDTLLPSTRLTQAFAVTGKGAGQPLPRKLVRGLHILAESVKRFLVKATQVGRVVIVTNACKGWVQDSGQRFMPSVIAMLKAMRIPVFSAQSAFGARYPTDPCEWKKHAFSREIDAHCRRHARSYGAAAADTAATTAAPLQGWSGLNVISVGDSDYEREAAHWVGRRQCVAAVKTVKFVFTPTVEQLRRQLSELTAQLEPVFLSAMSALNLEMANVANGNSLRDEDWQVPYAQA